MIAVRHLIAGGGLTVGGIEYVARSAAESAIDIAIKAERDACAAIAHRCSDEQTRLALGANAAINASQIARAILKRTVIE